MKESRKRSFPRPRGGQDAFRGRFFGGNAVFPPQVLRQGGGSCPPAAERVARLWAPPAPSRRASRGSAGGGFPGFADFTTWDRSARLPELSVPGSRGGDFLYYHDTIIARHACGNSSFRPARVPRNHFPRCNPRALPEIKDDRFPLHKRPVSTSPLPLTPAFLQPSASGERSDIPRPCLKKQGRMGWGIPLWRVLPPRRANLFRRLFPSSGKAAPAERKQTIFDCEESQVKLQYPCKTKNNKLFFINHITRSVHLSVFPARCRVQFSPPPSILRNSG